MIEQFDAAAQSYDDTFTNSCVGKAQRAQVWRQIFKLKLSKNLNVLEINCGTGVDAKRWYELGHEVLATDISSEMVRVASEQVPKVQFTQLDVNRLDAFEGQYDVIFSNFGGLNCLYTKELQSFLENAPRLLAPKGRLILVIMGKKCAWDWLYMLLKGKINARNRRNSEESVGVTLDSVIVQSMYYTPKEISTFAKEFQVERTRPIGLFVPPSYLAPTFENRPYVFGLFKFLDSIFSFRWLSNHADHYFISLVKKDV